MRTLFHYCGGHRLVTLVLGMILFLPQVRAQEYCFTEAGTLYHIDPILLRAIGMVESGLARQAVGINKNNKGKVVSRDYGIMQINDLHIPSLIRKGVISGTRQLTDDPCLNIKVGTYILHQHFSRCGMNWQCLGTYNAGFVDKNQKLRALYAKKVYRTYRLLKTNGTYGGDH